MAKKLAIPESNIEWPEYEHRPFPRWIGADKFGQDLVANNQDEADELAELKVYPKELGKDKNGNMIFAHNLDEERTKMSQVADKKPGLELADDEATAARAAELDRREKSLAAREAGLAPPEDGVSARERELDEREAALSAREAALLAQPAPASAGVTSGNAAEVAPTAGQSPKPLTAVEKKTAKTK